MEFIHALFNNYWLTKSFKVLLVLKVTRLPAAISIVAPVAGLTP